MKRPQTPPDGVASSDAGRGVAGSDAASVIDKIASISNMFAHTPLAQLRVRGADFAVFLEKMPGEDQTRPRPRAERPNRVQRAHDSEPGRQFDTIHAEVVGVFHAAPDLPEPGARIEADTVLGFIEALKLRTPVHSGPACVLVAQAIEDGQAVDFGETLFVVDREAGASRAAVAPAAVATPAETIAMVEPPRL